MDLIAQLDAIEDRILTNKGALAPPLSRRARIILLIQALLNRARYLVIIAVAGSLLAAVALLVYGGVEAVALGTHLTTWVSPETKQTLRSRCAARGHVGCKGPEQCASKNSIRSL